MATNKITIASIGKKITITIIMGSSSYFLASYRSFYKFNVKLHKKKSLSYTMILTLKKVVPESVIN